MSEYWIERQRELNRWLERADDKTAKQLFHHYDKLNQQITDEIAKYYGKYGADGVLEYRKMLEVGKIQEVDGAFYKLTHLENVQKMLISEIKALRETEESLLRKHFEEVARHAYDFSKKGLHSVNSLFLLDDNRLQSLLNSQWKGRNFSDSIWQNKEKFNEHYQRIFTSGLIRGASWDEMARLLSKATDTSKYNALRLIRTESQYYGIQANALAFEEDGVREYEFLAVEDNRTSDVCHGLSGEKFLMKERSAGINCPPMHVNCRSSIVPVVEKWEKSVDNSEDMGYNRDMIGIEIDELTPCLRDLRTGKLVDTSYGEITIDSKQAKEMLAQGWNFDWSKYEKGKVFSLTLENENKLQGLVALHDLEDHTFLDLIESAPHNLGKNKRYNGVGGHLFAIAAEHSFENGYDGFVAFRPKSQLYDYYANEFGAKRLPNGNMYLDTLASRKLLAIYMKK